MRQTKFYPSNDPKNQNFEKNERKAWRYHHFTPVCQKSFEIRHMTDVIFIFHFGLSPPLTTQKSKL